MLYRKTRSPFRKAIPSVYEIDRAWPPSGRRRGWLMRRLLLCADVIGLLGAYLVALALVPPASTADSVAPIWEVALFVGSLPLWVLLARVYGLYDRDEERTDHSTVDDVVGVFQVVTLGTWSFLVITHILDLPYPNLGRLVVFWLLAVALVPLLRAASRAIGRRQAAYLQNVIIVGSGQVAHLLADKIANHPEYGLRVAGSSTVTIARSCPATERTHCSERPKTCRGSFVSSESIASRSHSPPTPTIRRSE